MIRKILVLAIKWCPILQYLLLISNNILCLVDSQFSLDLAGVDQLYYVTPFITGNSLSFSFFLYIASIILHFPVWHRGLIITNCSVLLISLFNQAYEDYYDLCLISELNLGILYTGIQLLGLTVSIIVAYKSNYDKHKNFNIKTSITGEH